jgi:MASE7 protein
LSDLATNDFFDRARGNAVSRAWSKIHAGVRAFAAHPDPLVEAGNWVALTVGSHLPFWPLYIFWAAGWEAIPSALLTATMTPVFLAVPLLARWNGLWARIATPVFGITNTVFTIWILGINSGTEVFLVPCGALAAVIFRRTERLLMLGLTMLPLVVWYLLQLYPPTALHQYSAIVAREILVLNVFSIGILIVLFGWFQVDIYRKMETPEEAARH